jgi:hypothetical protein
MSLPRRATARPVNAPPFDLSCGEADNENIRNSRPTPQAQAAIADLHREFIAECLRIAAIKAAHGADNISLGDDLNAERDIRVSVENIREASKAFREWQALNEAMAAPIRVEAAR